MKKKALALEKEELAENQRRKDRSLKMRSPALLNKQALEKDNFKKKIQLELEIFEKEKLKNFEEYIVL
ncbi:hypothetical protein GW820_06985 [archaeon]|nr:hypothetical protein [archaeon]